MHSDARSLTDSIASMLLFVSQIGQVQGCDIGNYLFERARGVAPI